MAKVTVLELSVEVIPVPPVKVTTSPLETVELFDPSETVQLENPDE